jgi:hypothetical protein
MFLAGTEEIPTNNGAVLNISQIIKAVMSSAAKAKLGALFINAKMAVVLNTHSRNWGTDLGLYGEPQADTQG